MKNLFGLIPLLLLTVSCNGMLELFGEKVDVEGTGVAHDMIVLGSQLEDPFSVDVMTKAVASIYPTKADRIAISATNLYVRFLPADGDQLETLENMGLQLIDHPVDYEIVREGDWYHDPSIDDDKITWQYAVVDKNFVFPAGIKHEILDECYIPDNIQTKADWVDWELVEREAYILSGNEAMLAPETKGGGTAPKGRITIVDDGLGDEEIGVKGVTVSCNSFVKFAHAFTDEDGNYQMTRTFSSDPRYRLLFKNKLGFGIGFNFILVPASFSTLGKNSVSGVDVKVTSESDRLMYSRCAVNNAAYEYYKQCEDSSSSLTIKTPPGNLRFWLFQSMDTSSAMMLQQGAMIDGSIIEEYLGEYTFLAKMFLPDITLGLKGVDNYSDIFALTTHELAHASHFMLAGKEFWNKYIEYIISSFLTSGFVMYGVGTEENAGYCEVGEIWAYYMENKLYRERYTASNRTFGTSYWFTPQVLLTLDERGLSRYKIFQALLPDSIDMDTFEKCLISLYPEFKSAITQAFTRYN